MKRLSIIAALAVALCGCTVNVQTAGDKEQSVDAGTRGQQQEVVDAARRVTDLLDTGKAEEVWELTGPMLRAQSSQRVFVAGMKMSRMPLGKAGKREIKGFNFPKEVDGIAGDFGLVGLRTDFENAKGVEEKLVFQRIEGEWKLVGYWLSKQTTIGMARETGNPGIGRRAEHMAVAARPQEA